MQERRGPNQLTSRLRTKLISEGGRRGRECQFQVGRGGGGGGGRPPVPPDDPRGNDSGGDGGAVIILLLLFVARRRVPLL